MTCKSVPLQVKAMIVALTFRCSGSYSLKSLPQGLFLNDPLTCVSFVGCVELAMDEFGCGTELGRNWRPIEPLHASGPIPALSTPEQGLDPRTIQPIGDLFMNLSINPSASDAFRAARAVDCPVCIALRGEECAYTTAPVSVPVVAGTDVRPVHGYHAARLDAAGAHTAAGLGALAVVWDNGDAPRPADEAADADHEAARDMLGQIKERLDNIGYDVHELAKALEGPRGAVVALEAARLDEDDEDDGLRPYCTTCGQWASIFIGHGDGWHHYRGEGTVASPVELYDAGHEVTPGWVTPVPLSPASMVLVRQALADASAWRSEHAGVPADDRMAAYDELGHRLALSELAGAITAGAGL